MWVKICGNTSLEDAQLAAELGADAVGFVFAPSRRQVTAAEVARITADLPLSVEKVGVFPAWPAEQIAAAAWEAGLDTVQLHGGFTPVVAASLRSLLQDSVQVIQTLHWPVEDAGQGGRSAETIQQQVAAIRREAMVDRVLIDSTLGQITGGTGVSFDWTAAREIFASRGSGVQFILAGGLRQENLANAIELLQPWGVDVASGVEASAGRKDPVRLASFIQEARSAEQRLKASPASQKHQAG